MEWVASTLTPPPNVVYPAFLKLMRTARLPAVNRTDAPTDLNGLVRFGERRNLVSARVPSRSARAILLTSILIYGKLYNINKYIYIHTYIYTHTHMYRYVCVCVYIYIYILGAIPPIPHTPSRRNKRKL